MLPVVIDQTTGQEVSQPPSVLAHFPPFSVLVYASLSHCLNTLVSNCLVTLTS